MGVIHQIWEVEGKGDIKDGTEISDLSNQT